MYRHWTQQIRKRKRSHRNEYKNNFALSLVRLHNNVCYFICCWFFFFSSFLLLNFKFSGVFDFQGIFTKRTAPRIIQRLKNGCCFCCMLLLLYFFAMSMNFFHCILCTVMRDMCIVFLFIYCYSYTVIMDLCALSVAIGRALCSPSFSIRQFLFFFPSFLSLTLSLSLCAFFNSFTMCSRYYSYYSFFFPLVLSFEFVCAFLLFFLNILFAKQCMYYFYSLV